MAWTEQGRNIEAIARYFGAQAPRTAAAVAIRDEWQAFFSSLSAIELNLEQQAYDRARNIKLAYNRANAITPEERAAVEEQARTGLSTEEIEGDPDRRTSTGEYIPPPSPTGELAAGLRGAALVAVVGLGALIALKVRWL